VFVGLWCRINLFFAEHAGLVLKSGSGFGSGLFAAFDSFGGILTADADAGAGALATGVEALAVPLLALGLGASAALARDLLGDKLDSRPFDLVLHHQHLQGSFTLFVTFAVLAAGTDALITADGAIFKALAIQFQAAGLLTLAPLLRDS